MLDEKFDIILAEQVFEHVLWPYRAVRNVFQMLNPNGAFLVTTPFLVRIHGHPIDCSRWTELGMRHWLAEGGFDMERIVTGSWGNRACVRSNLLRWTPYNRWLHSLNNEEDYPVAVWRGIRFAGRGNGFIDRAAERKRIERHVRDRAERPAYLLEGVGAAVGAEI